MRGNQTDKMEEILLAQVTKATRNLNQNQKEEHLSKKQEVMKNGKHRAKCSDKQCEQPEVLQPVEAAGAISMSELRTSICNNTTTELSANSVDASSMKLLQKDIFLFVKEKQRKTQ